VTIKATTRRAVLRDLAATHTGGYVPM
jgi:hypothetical protein